MKKHFLKVALGLMGLMGTLAIGLLGIGGFSLAALDDSAFSYKGTGEAGVIYTDTNGKEFPMGTITITSGDESITILDRNLGATATGYCNSTSTCKTDTGYETLGYYFQRGNNYGFATSGTILSGNASDKNIDATLYGPNNPYSGGIFLKNSNNSPYDWATTPNNNLWGGSGDTTTITKVTNPGERQGPCPDGWHVPSYSEWSTLIDWIGSSNRETFREKLYIPYAGLRYYSSASPIQGDFTYLWSSSPNGTNSRNFFLINYSLIMGSNHRAIGLPVRCFYDSSSTVSQSFTLSFTGSEGGSVSTGSIEAEEGSSISRDDEAGSVTISGTVVATGIADEGYVFSGWLTDCGATLTANCTFTGEFKPIPYTITYLGTGDDYVPSATGYTIKSDAITLSNPTKTGYTFTGRSGTNIEGITGTVTISEGSTGDRTYEANWEANEYTITIDIDGNETILTGKYGDHISKPADPSKNGYKFIGWEPEFPTTMPLSGATVKAKWEKLGSSGGGGGSSKSSSDADTQKEDKTPTDSSAEPQNDNQNAQDSQQAEQASDKASEGQNQGKTYSEEFQEAYEFAKGKGITTMPTIQKADMDGKLTRIAMAKMLSYYAINVLGQKPANIITPKFNDVTEKMDSDYDDGVTLAYQLGIMGINMPNNKFRPNDEVTRGEFVTALSRMLYNTSDGEYRSTPKYYTHHMEKMEGEGIITNTNPNMKELRGYVMIMLMRSAK